MQDKLYDNFVERYALIPLPQLENSPLKPAGFAFEPLQHQIHAAGLNPDDFYFFPGTGELPYCYYRGMVLLDFPALDCEMDEIRTLIGRTEQALKDSVAKRDFDRFLSLVDSRLAPDLFMEVFNFIADHDKYRLFERLWRFNENSPKIFSQDFLKKVSKYKGVTINQPVADENGYVRIYRSNGLDELLPDKASCWTADVNIAILNALQFQPVPDIYQARIHQRHIIAYDSNRSKKELRVPPFQVEQLEVMDLINLFNFPVELRAAGILRQYYSYSQQIETEWFHNPSGVHALGHTKRVLFLSLMIGYLENYSAEDINLLCWAALYHDIGRTNDGYDPDHGIASYAQLVRKNLILLPDRQERESLRFLIQNHAIADQSAYKLLNRYELDDVDRTLRLFAAFKDADGLDRVRIGDLNPEYIRTRSAHRLLLAAHQLYKQHIF